MHFISNIRKKYHCFLVSVLLRCSSSLHSLVSTTRSSCTRACSGRTQERLDSVFHYYPFQANPINVTGMATGCLSTLRTGKTMAGTQILLRPVYYYILVAKIIDAIEIEQKNLK